MKWKDTTTYTRTDAARVPREFTLQVGRGHQDAILVHHYMGGGDAWFVTCYGVNVEHERLRAIGVEEAKVEAVTRVRARVDALAAEIRKATGT